MNSLPQTSLVIDPRYVIRTRYLCTPLTPAEVVRDERSSARTALFDHVLRDHDAMPEKDLLRWDDPRPFLRDWMTVSQQLDRLYEALLPHVTERGVVVLDDETEVHEMVFRVLGPATAYPDTLYPSRFEGGPADGSTTELPMEEIVRTEAYSIPDVESFERYPTFPSTPASYQFRGYDVLNRQAVYSYLGK